MSDYLTDIDAQQLVNRLAVMESSLSKMLNPLEISEAQFHQAQALSHLISQTALTVKDLNQFFGDKRLDYVALATRNIVELRIWTDYCIKSDENAKTFMYDFARDAFGLVAAFGRLAQLTSNPGAILAFVDTAKERLKAAGQSSDVKVEKNYIRIRNAAEALGVDSLTRYESLNTATSKFIHPTSFVINMNLPVEMSANFLRLFNHIALSDANYTTEATDKWFTARNN